MNRELKYIAESVFFLGLLFLLYKGYMAIAALMIGYVGLVLMCTVIVCIPTLAGILLYHTHQAFLKGSIKRKR